jgi:serine/threonine protein kinase
MPLALPPTVFCPHPPPEVTEIYAGDVVMDAAGIVRGWADAVLAGEPLPPRDRAVRSENGLTGIIGRLVGRGGFGEVWTCTTEDKRMLALKLARRGGPDARRLLLTERRILESMDIVGVPKLVGHGELEGQPFLLLEHVDGVTVASLLAASRGRPDHRGLFLRLLGEAASTLSMLHERGVVHGDVKPDNLLFGCIERCDARAWLIDFGLARYIGDEEEDTEPGRTMGTHGFIDPRCIGRAAERDCAADVFSLGATLYAAYAGEPLFSIGTWRNLLREKDVLPERSYGELCDTSIERRLRAVTHRRDAGIESLLRRMLTYAHRARISASDAAEELTAFASRAKADTMTA